MLRRYSDTASTVHSNVQLTKRALCLRLHGKIVTHQAELYSASFEKATILNDCYSQTCILNRS